MRRLWMLEKGILSSSQFIFQFSEGTFEIPWSSLEERISGIEIQKWIQGPRTLIETVSQILLRLLPLAVALESRPELPEDPSSRPASSQGAKIRSLEHVLRAVGIRKTTNAEDEALCLSAILGMENSVSYQKSLVPSVCGLFSLR